MNKENKWSEAIEPHAGKYGDKAQCGDQCIEAAEPDQTFGASDHSTVQTTHPAQGHADRHDLHSQNHLAHWQFGDIEPARGDQAGKQPQTNTTD
ncbi:hypothetical protein D3C78_1323710 [compost metagenome]